MSPEHKAHIIATLKDIAQITRFNLTPSIIETYLGLLADISLEDFNIGILRHLDTNKYFPAPSEIKQHTVISDESTLDAIMSRIRASLSLQNSLHAQELIGEIGVETMGGPTKFWNEWNTLKMSPSANISFSLIQLRKRVKSTMEQIKKGKPAQINLPAQIHGVKLIGDVMKGIDFNNLAMIEERPKRPFIDEEDQNEHFDPDDEEQYP